MTIDMHTHGYPRAYLEALVGRTGVPRVDRRPDGDHFVIFPDEEQLLGATRPITPSFFDLDEKIAWMNQHGIDRAVISIGNPWLDPFEPGEAREWAVRLNDELQQTCEQQPRFESFGVVPMQSVEGAVAEIERIAKFSHVHGVVVGTRPNGGFLDNPDLDPVWDAIRRNQLWVFLHPHYTVGYEWLTGFGHAPALALGFPFETTAAAVRLILSGVLDRFPDLRIMLAHGGGTLPYLAGRLDTCTSVDAHSRRMMQRSIPEYLRMFYYDAVVYDPDVLKLTMATASADHIAFGTDHPFGIADPDRIRAAIAGAARDETAATAMLGGNAVRWLNLETRGREG